VNELSLYILANKEHVADMDNYVNRIIVNVAEAMRH
jgi:hypothetical protein